MPAVSLDDIEKAYHRAQRSMSREIDEALEIIDDAQFDAWARDKNIVDAGFFILIFGQLERRITDIAVHKVNGPKHQRALRDAPFEKRLEIALRGQPDLIEQIEDWYAVRNDPAHGQHIASGYDIPEVLARAREVDAILAALP